MSVNYEQNAADEQFARAHKAVSLSDDEESESNGEGLSERPQEPPATSSSLAQEFYEEPGGKGGGGGDGETQEDEAAGGAANTHVVATHYNELKEAGRKDRQKSKIFFMRNFNNWVKSQLINEYMAQIKEQKRVGDALRVLDMCCGKGGDLLKWEKASISHLICTDIAEVSIEQCQRRYQDILRRAENSKFSNKFTAEFFACDSTLVRLRERYKDPSLQLNLVSCQFAFHYCFESLAQADCMMRNAAECLKPGGFFIATIPDAYEIVRRLKAAGPETRRFGNDVYSIEFDCETDPLPLFGAKYQFHLEGVVDCPEFLVHFPTLVKLGRKYGLQLIRRSTFSEYYKETLPKGRQLLQRMTGLETVQTQRHGSEEQFAHIRNFQATQRGRPLGTLSKSEWEAATLYLVCAFKKCKNSWDTNGKPVFEFDD
ncbi:mRNA cap guanine-N(7) methyltransferase [Drosophila bipectinata]|uniref:mRNA cap guanine-N(7) methyltransferase n=1 Tax=Drosophila bipectinata TaxID=42026 RepID=UPI0007E7754E|nr:mRNA cap guanine-N7 methyltransferase [Drosophila bipectinata]